MTNQPNVILIVLDTLRADTLVNNLGKLPNFQYLLKESTFFENAISPSSWTLPSHASMFTGLYPSEHGMDFKFDDDEYFQAISRFPEKTRPLQERMKQQGYDTVAIGANPLLGNGTAFEYGFRHNEVVGPWAVLEYFDKRIKEIAGPGHYLPWEDVYYESRSQLLKRIMRFGREIGPKRSMEIIRLLIWLRKTLAKLGFPVQKGSDQILDLWSSMKLEKPFFAFLNLMEIHEPYSILPNEFPQLERYYLKNSIINSFESKTQFDSILVKFRNQMPKELAILDDRMGRIISYLKSNDLYDDSTIIITSDHGQSLGENNFVGHKYMLNDALVHVPLIIKNKATAPKIEKRYVSLVDIHDYILSIINGGSSEFPVRDYVFSEAFGLNSAWWTSIMGNLSGRYRPEIRKRIWSQDGYSLTLNGTSGEIEEFSYLSKKTDVKEHISIKDQLLNEMNLFIGNSEFQIPVRF